MSIPPEIAFRAFDALAAMRRCETADDLDTVMADALNRVGLPWFSLARFFHRDGSPATAVLQGRFEPGWASRYVEQNYAASSLIARELLHRSDSYSWREILARNEDPIQDRIFHEARDHGLRDGLFTPVRLADQSYAAVVTAGSHAELDDPMYRTMTEVLSTYYAHECRRLGVAPPAIGTILSPRQRDCLAWVRHGKSSTDIAELLGISAQTVEEHVAQACRKLGVRTRVQAAVEASLLGVI